MSGISAIANSLLFYIINSLLPQINKAICISFFLLFLSVLYPLSKKSNKRNLGNAAFHNARNQLHYYYKETIGVLSIAKYFS